MASKLYALCLCCGKFQIKSDVIADLSNKNYVLLDKKIMCHVCGKNQQFMVTRKNKKQLIKALENSENVLDKKIQKFIRG